MNKEYKSLSGTCVRFWRFRRQLMREAATDHMEQMFSWFECELDFGDDDSVPRLSMHFFEGEVTIPFAVVSEFAHRCFYFFHLEAEDLEFGLTVEPDPEPRGSWVVNLSVWSRSTGPQTVTSLEQLGRLIDAGLNSRHCFDSVCSDSGDRSHHMVFDHRAYEARCICCGKDRPSMHSLPCGAIDVSPLVAKKGGSHDHNNSSR